MSASLITASLRRRAPRHTWRTRGLGLVVASTVGVVGLIGVARAASPDAATFATSIQVGASCPVDEQTGTAIGAATFTRQGDRLTVVVALTAAAPDTSYGVQLWDADTCEPIATFRDLTTRDMGEGKVRGRADAAGYSSFFATVVDPDGGRNDSLPVSLPSS